jgi:valyl-tRNA synthetase
MDNKRGKGTKVTEAELDAYIRTVREEHPDSPLVSERRYAVWIVGMSMTPARWATAWARVEAGEPPLVEEEAKPAAKRTPAKKAAPVKAAAKKAPAKKAAPVNPLKAARASQKATRAKVSAAGKAAAAKKAGAK